MIFDKIKNASVYKNGNAALETALEEAAKMSLAIQNGRHEFKNGVFVNVMTIAPKDRADALYETHKRYLDLQLILEGSETVLINAPERLCETIPYNEEKDIAHYTGDGFAIPVAAGEFYLVYPWDAHAPSLKASHDTLKKAVFKIPFQVENQ